MGCLVFTLKYEQVRRKKKKVGASWDNLSLNTHWQNKTFGDYLKLYQIWKDKIWNHQVCLPSIIHFIFWNRSQISLIVHPFTHSPIPDLIKEIPRKGEIHHEMIRMKKSKQCNKSKHEKLCARLLVRIRKIFPAIFDLHLILEDFHTGYR